MGYKHDGHGSAGYTLIIVAALLIALAGITAVTLRESANTQTQVNTQSTHQKLQSIRGAMTRYFEINNEFPCPAAPNISARNAGTNFGQSLDCTAGTPTGGVRELGASSDVWEGMIPVATLGLTRDFAEDEWGNKIMYAIHKDLSSAPNSIQVQDESGNNLGNQPYMIYSLGSDGFGAWPIDGTSRSSGCPNTGANKRDENCDDDTIFVESSFATSANTDIAEFFDDVMVNESVSTCPPATLSWGGNCTANFVRSRDGESQIAANINANYTGTATANCTNGSFSTPTGACLPIVNSCPTQSLSWGSGCSASFAGIGDSQTSPSTTNTASGFTGSATATCNDGTWSAPSGSCTAAASNCSTQSLSWGAGCSASFAGINDGQTSPSTTNTAAGFTGNATATCNSGTWSTPSGSCNFNISGCPSSHPVGLPLIYEFGDPGDCNTKCIGNGGNGVFSEGAGSSAAGACCCVGTASSAPCSTQSLSWGAGCSASFAGINDGQTSPSTTNTTHAYTGSATATCNDGTWSTPSGSCNPICIGHSSGQCDEFLPNMGVIGDTASTMCGPGCSGVQNHECLAGGGGMWTPIGACQVGAAASCPTQSLSWGGGCSASFAGIADSQTSPSTANTAANFTGSATATCSDGTWSTPTGTCEVDIGCNCTVGPSGFENCVGNGGLPNSSCFPGGGPGGCGANQCSGESVGAGASCCYNDGDVFDTFGAGCRTYRCNGSTGVLEDQGGPSFCDADAGFCPSSSSGAATAGSAPCSTQSLSWGAGCSASFAGINDSQISPSTANTAANFTGSATAICSDGTWGTPSGSCESSLPPPPPGCPANTCDIGVSLLGGPTFNLCCLPNGGVAVIGTGLSCTRQLCNGSTGNTTILPSRSCSAGGSNCDFITGF